jgi:hypothetical protein
MDEMNMDDERYHMDEIWSPQIMIYWRHLKFGNMDEIREIHEVNYMKVVKILITCMGWQSLSYV